ncbi:MAG: serine/threonine protein kinase [Planctomycetota bacterium]|jgi:serine/threonine protein kinase
MKNISLANMLKNEGPLSLEIAWHWFRGMLVHLNEIHQSHQTHGDIKPENIVLLERGEVKMEGVVPNSKPGFASGTTLYMAPELLTSATGGPESDIYALGVVFYECLSGRKPHEFSRPDEPLIEFADRLVHEDAPLLSTHIEVPNKVDVMVGKMLARQPRQRYRKMKKLLSDFDKIKTA